LKREKILFAPRNASSQRAFVNPELPRGRTLKFNVLSTWGDPHYVGLMGLEIFDERGKVLELSDIGKQLWADPADINVLDDYEEDPRTVDKLLGTANNR